MTCRITRQYPALADSACSIANSASSLATLAWLTCCREPHHKSSDQGPVQHAMALLQAATCASRSLPSTNAPLPALLRTTSLRISYSATAISRRPKIGNWTALERRCFVGTEPRWRWRAESISKTGAQIRIPQSRWKLGQKGQQQLRWLTDGPRNVEPQDQKKYATTPPRPTTTIIIITIEISLTTQSLVQQKIAPLNSHPLP